MKLHDWQLRLTCDRLSKCIDLNAACRLWLLMCKMAGFVYQICWLMDSGNCIRDLYIQIMGETNAWCERWQQPVLCWMVGVFCWSSSHSASIFGLWLWVCEFDVHSWGHSYVIMSQKDVRSFFGVVIFHWIINNSICNLQCIVYTVNITLCSKILHLSRLIIHFKFKKSYINYEDSH